MQAGCERDKMSAEKRKEEASRLGFTLTLTQPNPTGMHQKLHHHHHHNHHYYYYLKNNLQNIFPNLFLPIHRIQ